MFDSVKTVVKANETSASVQYYLPTNGGRRGTPTERGIHEKSLTRSPTRGYCVGRDHEIALVYIIVGSHTRPLKASKTTRTKCRPLRGRSRIDPWLRATEHGPAVNRNEFMICNWVQLLKRPERIFQRSIL